MYPCVCVCLYSTTEERCPLIAVGRLVGRDLQAMGRLALRQLLTLTIEFSLELNSTEPSLELGIICLKRQKTDASVMSRNFVLKLHFQVRCALEESLQ